MIMIILADENLLLTTLILLLITLNVSNRIILAYPLPFNLRLDFKL